MYVLAKFQLKTVEVIALQSSSSKKINLYSMYRKNKLQLFIKTNLTCKRSDLQTQNLHHRVRHELKNGLLGKLFHCFATNKVEIHEETRIATTTVMSHELTA